MIMMNSNTPALPNGIDMSNFSANNGDGNSAAGNSNHNNPVNPFAFNVGNQPLGTSTVSAFLRATGGGNGNDGIGNGNSHQNGNSNSNSNSLMAGSGDGGSFAAANNFGLANGLFQGMGTSGSSAAAAQQLMNGLASSTGSGHNNAASSSSSSNPMNFMMGGMNAGTVGSSNSNSIPSGMGMSVNGAMGGAFGGLGINGAMGGGMNTVNGMAGMNMNDFAELKQQLKLQQLQQQMSISPLPNNPLLGAAGNNGIRNGSANVDSNPNINSFNGSGNAGNSSLNSNSIGSSNIRGGGNNDGPMHLFGSSSSSTGRENVNSNSNNHDIGRNSNQSNVHRNSNNNPSTLLQSFLDTQKNLGTASGSMHNSNAVAMSNALLGGSATGAMSADLLQQRLLMNNMMNSSGANGPGSQMGNLGMGSSGGASGMNFNMNSMNSSGVAGNPQMNIGGMAAIGGMGSSMNTAGMGGMGGANLDISAAAAAAGLSNQQSISTAATAELPLPSPHSLFHRDGTRRMRGGVIEPFPEKLHRLLLEVEGAGRSDVISFVANGRAFAIHKPDKFFKEIVPLYFRQSRLSSFKRQLNLYGFELINTGPARGGYYHELFVKDRPELCRRMRRVAVKVVPKQSQSSSPSRRANVKRSDSSHSDNGGDGD